MEHNKILLDIHSRIAVVETNIKDIKQDLKEHIKRTAQNEAEIKYNRRHIAFAQGALAIVGALFTLIITLLKLGILHTF